MNQKIKRIWNGATTVLVALVVVFAALLWGVRLVGLEALVVQSGSMEPEFHTGAIVYIRDVDPATLKEKDVITFRLSGSLRATHRIIEVTEADGQVAFRTKGDANDHPDNGLVTPDVIEGKVVFSVPCLGYAAAYIQSRQGTYVAISVAAVIMLLMVLPDLIFNDKKKS